MPKPRRKQGFTLAELVIVLAVAAILAIAAFAGMMVQVAKARDSRRKADLDQLRGGFENFFNDFNRFPRESELPGCWENFDKYLASFPCDPVTGNKYNYETDAVGLWFRVYAKLERENDPVIWSVGCGSGCGPEGVFNYGVSSGNVGLGISAGGGATPTPTASPPTPTATPGEAGVAPECGGPGQWYCYANVCAECCPGSGYRCNSSGTRCIIDNTCGN